MHPAHTRSSHTPAHLQTRTRTVHLHGTNGQKHEGAQVLPAAGTTTAYPTACTVTEQRLHAYERQRSETVTAIRTSAPPADAGARRVESASERRACEREKCNVRRNQTKFNGSITTTRADLESSSLGQKRPRAETARPRQESTNRRDTHRLHQGTLPLPQRANKQQQRCMADDLRRRNSHLRMCKDRKSTTLQTQKQQQAPQVRQQGNGTVAAAGTAGAAAGKKMSKKGALPGAQKSSAIPVQELSHRPAQYQFEHSPSRIVQRNTSTRIVASSSAIPVRAFPKRSERHTAPMSPAHTGRRRHNAQGERQAKEATQAGAELQAGGAQERAQIESTVNLLRPDYHHRPWVTSNRTLRT
jgi:hypothetical protein